MRGHILPHNCAQVLKNIISHEYLLKMADLPVCYAVYAKQLLQHIDSSVKVQYS